MSRAYECDDFDTWVMIRWYGASKRAIGGKPGQKFLKELEQAILDLPTRRLVGEVFAEEGDVCALGAVAKKRGMGDLSGLEDETEHEVGDAFGITPTLAWEIMYANDECYGMPTPEQRYERVLRWIHNRIKEEAPSNV